MKVNNNSLIGIVNPKPNSIIMIYDVHASETGALAILDDLYQQIKEYPDKTIKWIFIVSIPKYKETENIIVRRFPWIKKNWGFRYYFDTITTRRLLKEFKPDKVFSLQNKGITFYHREQAVYLHLPSILTDHKFNLRMDGKTLWFHQNVLKKSIFSSLRKVEKIIVQTQWMKTALIEKANIDKNKIIILAPDISSNNIGKFIDNAENRKRFFYPAASYTYKNHLTILRAINYVQEHGLRKYEVIFTISSDENTHTKNLFKFASEHKLNVIFKGKISREQVFEMYTKSVLLFPSYVESFGMPLLEAKLTGTYVIASDCPFSREILEDYNKASFFNEMDYKKLGDFILELQK